MSELTIRQAGQADAVDIARLVTQLGYPTSPAEMAERLESILRRPEYITFVAEISAQVVGMIGAYVGYAIEFTGVYGRLTGIVVEESFRGRGIGKLLMEKVEAWLQDQGVKMVILTSGKHRTETHEFYRALGYEETGLRFVKRFSW